MAKRLKPVGEKKIKTLKAPSPPVKAQKINQKFLKAVLDFFDEYYPNPECALIFNNPFELLVATILSAQCTDVRVNKTTPQLFSRYPEAVSLATADILEVENIIRPCGFYHNKAQNILGMSRVLVDTYGGQVPETLELLIKL
ncbi:MAG: endonuclease III domain-containing protein, partial [Candidatus Adiutrix sp.]